MFYWPMCGLQKLFFCTECFTADIYIILYYIYILQLYFEFRLLFCFDAFCFTSCFWCLILIIFQNLFQNLWNLVVSSLGYLSETVTDNINKWINLGTWGQTSPESHLLWLLHPSKLWLKTKILVLLLEWGYSTPVSLFHSDSCSKCFPSRTSALQFYKKRCKSTK